jgi:meso-butanediol dehydrogenase/(S,S)-butanediol dehydrogenase/diacetyl reductase
MEGLLQDKVAIVTGAASGIGRAICASFVREGAAVLAVDRSEDGLRGTAELIGAPDGRLATAVVDVTSEEQLGEALDGVLSRWGRLTTLVNNAGVSRPGTVEETSPEDWDLTFAVNVRAAYLASRLAIPAMRAAGGGSIVNTGSANSLGAERSLAAYCASKGAILMLSRAMALDHAAEGIRCNCVLPGFVDTPINIPHYERLGGIDKVREGLADWVPLRRDGAPGEIAEAFVYLASDRSSYVTGTALSVDGGLTAQI